MWVKIIIIPENRQIIIGTKIHEPGFVDYKYIIFTFSPNQTPPHTPKPRTLTAHA